MSGIVWCPNCEGWLFFDVPEDIEAHEERYGCRI